MTICPQTPHLSGTLSALNGVRGIAVILVFLFHAGVPGFTGAFIGVDIFFVLSGFLITVLLLQEHQRNGSISLKKFYLRRVLRLLPALLVLLACYLTYWFLVAPDSATRLYHLQDAAMSLFYVANWTRAFGLDRPYHLGHCWSLSIEEQFYAVWPLILLLLLRLNKAGQIVCVSAMFLASWGWRVWLLAQGAEWARLYNGFDTRADMLLAGCLLALLWNAGALECWRRLLSAPVVTWSAAASLGVLAVTARWQTSILYQWQYLLVALATLLILFGLLERPGILTQLLSWPPLVGLGTISYALYLWHYPLLHLMSRHGFGGSALVIWTAILTVGVSIISWYGVERPALQMKQRIASAQK
ncbi:acyltransferase family protein [Pelovirga terrestris]|uniref:Acyltransferase n=1 Tax=Pelovirga terrestris TaxID=2771352 RepID=A0A8J6QQL4_9BACT|nr:acyltransferase [Pelovirga terrestris]MBD1401321.1 acyltransferase [Pelovirga terrestris]